MTVEEALRDLLTRAPDVRERLGDRLYPVQLPQGLETWPAATYRRVSAVRTQSHAGPSGLVAVRLQVDIYSREAADRTAFGNVVAVGDALRRALDGFRGLIGTLRVDRILLDAERDDYDPAEARKLWRRSQDYRIWAAEQ